MQLQSEDKVHLSRDLLYILQQDHILHVTASLREVFLFNDAMWRSYKFQKIYRSR
jgi:hypothetical protein